MKSGGLTDETKPERKEAHKMEKEKNMPEKKISTGAISATIWQNEAKTQKGDSTVYRTVTLQRTYKDKDNKWQHTNSMRANDLPKAALVLNKAYEYIVLRDNNPQTELSEEDIVI